MATDFQKFVFTINQFLKKSILHSFHNLVFLIHVLLQCFNLKFKLFRYHLIFTKLNQLGISISFLILLLITIHSLAAYFLLGIYAILR